MVSTYNIEWARLHLPERSPSSEGTWFCQQVPGDRVKEKYLLKWLRKAIDKPVVNNVSHIHME